MNYAIILAGGIGSRFWPLSKYSHPKQFLNLFQDRSMLEESINRISSFINEKNIYIATNIIYNQKIKKYLGKFNIPKDNILFEPKTKNNFAPISVLSKKINDIDSDAIIAVFPCDHFIKYTKKFAELLNKAIEAARQGYIVTLGIPPTRAETGYGYIRIKNKKSKVYKVDRFIEKPNLSKAREFIKDKRYYWNGGIFIFRADVILDEIKRFMPGVYKEIIKMDNKQKFNRLWQGLPPTSIDYAIMEKTKKLVLLPVDYGWIDLGSWQAMGEIMKKDKDGNIFQGKCIDIASKNILVWSKSRLTATLGLSNIIIVDTKDALLVCSKDKTQDVKKIVEILNKKNFKK